MRWLIVLCVFAVSGCSQPGNNPQNNVLPGTSEVSAKFRELNSIQTNTAEQALTAVEQNGVELPETEDGLTLEEVGDYLPDDLSTLTRTDENGNTVTLIITVKELYQ